MQNETDVTVREVLRHLVQYGPLSRPELGDGVGLARATTSTLVNELMRRGLVGEIRTTPQGRRGRPSSLLDLDDDNHACVGLEIGLDRVLAAGYSLRGRELVRVEQPVQVDLVNPRAIMREAANTLYGVIRFVEEADRELLGVGISVPGLVDAASGLTEHARGLRWRDMALGVGNETAFASSGKVAVGKDADFAALAERRARLRAGLTADSILYLAGTHGISAGIVTLDHLWRGARGLAGEIGHLIVDPAGPPCPCGRRGCLDVKAGMGALVRAALPEPAPRAVPHTLAAAVEEVVLLASKGDERVTEAIADAGRWLGRGAAAVCSVLDPRVVVLGGHYARLAPWLLEPAQEAFAAAVVVPDEDLPAIEIAIRGPWAAAEGAALAVLMEVIEAPLTTRRDS